MNGVDTSYFGHFVTILASWRPETPCRDNRVAGIDPNHGLEDLFAHFSLLNPLIYIMGRATMPLNCSLRAIWPIALHSCIWQLVAAASVTFLQQRREMVQNDRHTALFGARKHQLWSIQQSTYLFYHFI